MHLLQKRPASVEPSLIVGHKDPFRRPGSNKLTQAIRPAEDERDELQGLFDNDPLAGLLIFKGDVVGKGRSSLGIGLESMGIAPLGNGFRIDVCANRNISAAFNQVTLLSDKGFPVFVACGHISGVGKDIKGLTVCTLVLEPRNTYDIAHSDPSFL